MKTYSRSTLNLNPGQYDSIQFRTYFISTLQFAKKKQTYQSQPRFTVCKNWSWGKNISKYLYIFSEMIFAHFNFQGIFKKFIHFS